MKNVNKRWHRRGRVDRQDALLQKFVSNGFGTDKKSAAATVTENINRGITAQEVAPYARENLQRIRDARDIYNILPDLKYAAAMGTAMILSTDDLITVSLIYESSSNLISLEMKSRLATAINEHMRNHVKLNEKLYDIVYNMRFVTGSYPIAILPEASIDDIINGDIAKVKTGNESVNERATPLGVKNLGILGDPNGVPNSLGLESYFRRRTVPADATHSVSSKLKLGLETIQLDDICPTIDFTLTDNIQVLRLPEYKRRLDSEMASKTYMGNENFTIPRNESYWDKLEEEKPDIDFFASKTFKYQHIAAIKAANMTSRVSVDHPTVMDLPAGSVMMVHSPGTYLKPIGGLMLLDELGYPISENNHYTMVINNHISRNMTSVNIDAVAKATGVAKDRVFSWTERRLAELTRELVTAKFVNSIKNGNYGHGNIQLADNDSFIRTMLAAALAGKRTQLLFIPAEQLTYFATEFDENGIGISVIESTKILASMCVGNKFAAMHAAINNARSITTVTITLDPDERDPEAKIERQRDDLASSISQPIPITGSADDWNKHLSNRGLVFNIQGNEHYPSSSTDIKSENSRYEYPDENMSSENKKDLYTSMGVNPSLIMEGGPVETATEVSVKDLHAAKLAMTEQSKLSPLLSNFVRNYIYSDPLLLDELAKVVEDVIYDRIKAKKISRRRIAEAESAEELKKLKNKEGGNDTVETAAPPATEEEESDVPAGSEEEKLGSEVDDQNEDTFSFENGNSTTIIRKNKLGVESFVDFYEKAGAMTPDNLEDMNSPKSIRKILSEFVRTLAVTLPGPENAKVESAMEQLSSRAEHITKAVEWMWPDGTFPEESEMYGKESNLRSSVLSYEIINYMRSRDIFPSITKIIDYDEGNEGTKELIDDVVKRGIGAMTIMKNINERKVRHAEALDIAKEDDSSSTDTSSDNDWGSDTTDDDNFNDDTADQNSNEFNFDAGDEEGAEGGNDDTPKDDTDTSGEENGDFKFNG